MKSKTLLLLFLLIASFNTLKAQVTAVPDHYTLAQDTVLQGYSVLANDNSTLGIPLKASVITFPANGTLLLDSNGTFVYVPNTGFNGNDSFIYAACENALSCDTAFVSLVVTPCSIIPANAGPDISICGTYCGIQANSAISGTGLWTIVSGPGGYFSDAQNAYSLLRVKLERMY